jgi:3-oxoacyl-[acyl-carrier protein] reductase
MSAAAPAEPSYPDLAGKVAVVTGGSRGIGQAAARALAANEALVALIARDPQPLAAAAESIQADGGRAVAIPADATAEAELQQAALKVGDQLGAPEILLAFAGGQGAPIDTVTETAAHWSEVIDANLTATFLTIAAFLPVMIERKGGTIITMASSAARQATQASAAYAAAKGGVIALTRHLAGELAGDGIRVNCLAPAAIENERMRAHMSDDALRRLAGSFPLGRIGQPPDVAAAALFLASEASSWITGITLDVAGGGVMP